MSDQPETTSHCQSEDLFLSPWTYGDVILEVEGKELHASKTVLMMCSPVFEAMFQNDCIEKTTSRVNLPGKEFKIVLEFLRFLHPQVRGKITGKSKIHCVYEIHHWKTAMRSALKQSTSCHMQILRRMTDV